MKIFVSGATGFVGQNLCRQLAEDGHTVHALCRWAGPELDHEQIRIFKGDLLDRKSIETAMDGCEAVYHLAAFAKPWHKDPHMFHKVNVLGTINILESAHAQKVRKVVFTSTAGVLGPSREKGRMVDEQETSPFPLQTEYERTKQEAEQLTHSFLDRGLDIVTVNPTRIYGPGALNESNSVTRLIRLFSQGKWYFVPGNGESIGNYVYINDVVNGHLLAMKKGQPGERYILGGTNISYNGLFQLIRELTRAKQPLFRLPLPLMLLVANEELLRARLFGKSPLITPPFVKKYHYDWLVTSNKAETHLGYHPTPLKEGIETTLIWLKENV